MYSQGQTTRRAATEIPPVERLDSTGRYYATIRLLAECIESCETLSDQLGGDPSVIWLQDLLAESVAACSAYLASMERGSRYAFRYAALAGELVGTLADALTPRGDLASKFCEVLCRAMDDFVCEESAAAVAN